MTKIRRRAKTGAPSVLIIGLGQIGGSFASALRKARWKGELYGVDRKKDTVRKAAARRIIDGGGTGWKSLVPLADIVILATPTPSILELLLPVGQLMKDGAVLFDVGSTKRLIVSEMKRLPVKVLAIGGHPVAGTEKEGPAGWDAELFRDKDFILCPVQPGHRGRGGMKLSGMRAPGKNRITPVLNLLKTIGATPVEMDAAVHDRVFALTSHLPYAISLALVEMFCKEKKRTSAVNSAIGGSFLSATRVAASSPEMAGGILETNAAEVVKRINELGRELARIAAWLEKRKNL